MGLAQQAVTVPCHVTIRIVKFCIRSVLINTVRYHSSVTVKNDYYSSDCAGCVITICLRNNVPIYVL